ncbi:hypothetical protein [Streptomyces sp. YGL11-2]
MRSVAAQADLLTIAGQARQIMRRHPWLPAMAMVRPPSAPTGSTY